MALSIGTRELPISPILHPWRWRMISPPASARTSDFIQRRHPSTGSARRNQDGTHTLQYIHPSSFLSVSYVSGCRPKSVLARHAPYLLNSCIKIYTFNPRQQPTYQHSTFFSSLPPFSPIFFHFKFGKQGLNACPFFFFFFRKGLGSVARPFVIYTYPSQQLSLYMTFTNLRTTNAHRSKRRWKQIYESPSLLSYWTNHVQVGSRLSFLSRTARGRCLWLQHRDHPPKSPYSLAQWTPWRWYYICKYCNAMGKLYPGWSTAAGMYVRYLVGVGTTYSAPSSRRVIICRKGTPPPPSPVRP